MAGDQPDWNTSMGEKSPAYGPLVQLVETTDLSSVQFPFESEMGYHSLFTKRLNLPLQEVGGRRVSKTYNLKIF